MSKKIETKDLLKTLQLKMLRIQQCVWHKKDRVIIVFEGFDAAGKGGSIRRITEMLDPRGYRVHPIGPPSPEDQGKHYLYRFWMNLPARGIMAIFDRSWYGRVLVERVEKLIPRKRWQEAYSEIREFERMLTQDGIILIKIFLQISKAEQYRRFIDRLNDPYKHWKITEDDIRARKEWNAYARATKDMIKETSTASCPWHVVDANDKDRAREEVLTIITERLKQAESWSERHASKRNQRELKEEVKKLK